MVKLAFNNKALEKMFRAWKFARIISLELFDAAQGNLDYKQLYKKDDYTILFQFLCLTTTTDAYYRKITGAKNKQFGVLIKEGTTYKKAEIANTKVKQYLTAQIEELDTLLKGFDEKKFEASMRYLSNLLAHEYLHQGQLVVMFREAGIPFPKRFQETWAL